MTGGTIGIIESNYDPLPSRFLSYLFTVFYMRNRNPHYGLLVIFKLHYYAISYGFVNVFWSFLVLLSVPNIADITSRSLIANQRAAILNLR